MFLLSHICALFYIRCFCYCNELTYWHKYILVILIEEIYFSINKIPTTYTDETLMFKLMKFVDISGISHVCDVFSLAYIRRSYISYMYSNMYIHIYMCLYIYIFISTTGRKKEYLENTMKALVFSVWFLYLLEIALHQPPKILTLMQLSCVVLWLTNDICNVRYYGCTLETSGKHFAYNFP